MGEACLANEVTSGRYKFLFYSFHSTFQVLA
jgi:hypothetical protein